MPPKNQKSPRKNRVAQADAERERQAQAERERQDAENVERQEEERQAMISLICTVVVANICSTPP